MDLMRLFPCGLWDVIAFGMIPARWRSCWNVWWMNTGPLLCTMLRGHGYLDNHPFLKLRAHSVDVFVER